MGALAYAKCLLCEQLGPGEVSLHASDLPCLLEQMSPSGVATRPISRNGQGASKQVPFPQFWSGRDWRRNPLSKQDLCIRVRKTSALAHGWRNVP